MVKLPLFVQVLTLFRVPLRGLVSALGLERERVLMMALVKEKVKVNK